MVDGHIRNYDKIQDKAGAQLRTDIQEHPKSCPKPERENSIDEAKFQKFCEKAHLTHQWVNYPVNLERDGENSSYYSETFRTTVADPVNGTDFKTENRCNR